jgi:hypothetical protein
MRQNQQELLTAFGVRLPYGGPMMRPKDRQK